MATENFSAADIRIVMAVIKNIKTIDVNWDNVASDGNYSTAKYARDSWAVFRKNKLGAEGATKLKRDKNGEDEGQAKATKKEARGGKKGAKAKAGTDTNANDEAEGQVQVKAEEQSRAVTICECDQIAGVKHLGSAIT